MTDWRNHANCLGHDPEIWFRGDTEIYAKAICSTCEVKSECLAYCRSVGGMAGIWGGQTQYERRRASSNGNPHKLIPDCGTYAGYQSHKRHNEKACDPCIEAHREYNRMYYHQQMRNV